MSKSGCYIQDIILLLTVNLNLNKLQDPSNTSGPTHLNNYFRSIPENIYTLTANDTMLTTVIYFFIWNYTCNNSGFIKVRYKMVLAVQLMRVSLRNTRRCEWYITYPATPATDKAAVMASPVTLPQLLVTPC